MDDREKINDILSRPGRVRLAGTRSVKKRPLANKFKELLRVGTLSAILLAQAVQGIHASPLMEHMFQDNASSPVAVQVVSEQAPEMDAVEFINPLERAGLEHISMDNGINGVDILREWRDAGIEPDQVLQLTQTLLVTQSPIFVRGEQAKEKALELAEKTAGMFSLENQQQAVEFLKENSVQALADQGLVSAAASRTYVRTYPTQDFENAVSLWELSSLVADDDGAAPLWTDENPDQTSVRYERSIELLTQSVQETGLRSLRVPMPMWTSSDRLDALSSDLIKANHELQEVTGWEGQVVGVKGHMNLMVGAPYKDGGVTHSGDGQFDTFVAMNGLDHEVFHVIDGLAAYHAGYSPSDHFPTLMGEHAAHHHDGTSHHPAQVWGQLEKEVDPHLRDWSDNLHAKALTGEQGVSPDLVEYATASHEKLAYAFETVVAAKLGEGSVLAKHSHGERLLTPSREMAGATIQAWESAFQALNDTWWSKIPNVGQEQELSAALADANAIQDPVVLEQPSPSKVAMEVSIPSLSSWRKSRSTTPEMRAPTIKSSRGPSL